jgi:hypothetical protein
MWIAVAVTHGANALVNRRASGGAHSRMPLAAMAHQPETMTFTIKDKQMTLHKKAHIEKHKDAAAKKLVIRLEALKTLGMDERAIRKDAVVRQIKAAIRQAKRQMDRIAEIEALDRKKAETREQKLHAPKVARPKAKKGSVSESKRKAKREKKLAMQGKKSDSN